MKRLGINKQEKRAFKYKRGYKKHQKELKLRIKNKYEKNYKNRNRTKKIKNDKNQWLCYCKK